jgi:malonyl-CoA decarboxylase
MVNYRYDLAEIERNHEAYAQDGTVAASRAVKAHFKSGPKVKDPGAVTELLALPGRTKTTRTRPRDAE